MVSFDGLAADLAPNQPAFAALPMHVRRVIPVNPTVTSSTHAAILTGATPEQTGILSNHFEIDGVPAEGLSAEIRADTLLDAARKNGKRTGSIIFPTVDGRTPRRRADFGLFWSEPIAAPRTITLTRADFVSDWLPPGWGVPQPRHPSFSPVLRAHLTWNGGQKVDLVAYDTTDDQVRNYDELILENGSDEIALAAGKWFALTTADHAGSWSKVLRADPSPAITIYEGIVDRTEGYPEPYVRMVESEAGFWPGVPDDRADPAIFVEEMQRFSDFLTRATTATMQRMPFDLLLAYQPIIDQTAHPFGPASPMTRTAYEAFDHAVATLTQAIDPARDALIVTGDHGMAAIDTLVHLGAVLPPGWHAQTSGNVAKLYGQGGDVVSVLTNLRAPDGTPVFERVDATTAYAFPRFALSPAGGELFVKPQFGGQHGGLNTHPELQTTLGATGRGIPPGVVAELPQTAIAPFVAKLAGFSFATIPPHESP